MVLVMMDHGAGVLMHFGDSNKGYFFVPFFLFFIFFVCVFWGGVGER